MQVQKERKERKEMKKIYRIVKSTTNCSTNSKRNNTSTQEPIIDQRFPEYSQGREKPIQGLQLIIDIENIQDAQSFTVYSVPSSHSPSFVRQEKKEKEENEGDPCAMNQKVETKSEPICERTNESKDISKDESEDISKDISKDKSEIDVYEDVIKNVSKDSREISHISSISHISQNSSSNSNTHSIDFSECPVFLDRPDGMSDSVFIKMARKFEMEQKKRNRKREVGGKQNEKKGEVKEKNVKRENVSSEKSLPIKQSFESNDVDSDAYCNMTPKMRIRFELQKKREMILAEKRIKNKQEEEKNIK